MKPRGNGALPLAGLWVWLEHREGQLSPVSLELLGKGRALCNQAGCSLVGVAVGARAGEAALSAGQYGAEAVLLVEHPQLATFSPELYAVAVAECVERYRPQIFLLGATSRGRDLAGRLAVRLRTGLVADCTDLSIGQERLLHCETAGFGGGVLATILCRERRPQMATVRPGVFTAPAASEQTTFRLHVHDVTEAMARAVGRVRRAQVVEEERRPHRALEKAPVLVIAGRGIGGKMAPLERLAERLGGAVAATRVAVDLGWADREAQIGQTGLSARPEVAIVAGASGAFQFTVGIQGAGTVIAINTDPEAPIFDAADYCVVGDAAQVVDALLAELEAGAGRKPAPGGAGRREAAWRTPR